MSESLLITCPLCRGVGLLVTKEHRRIGVPPLILYEPCPMCDGFTTIDWIPNETKEEENESY